MIDQNSSRIKAVLHGFFLSITTTIAEPAIILPLILNFFGAGNLVIGFLSSLLKGGAIMVQLFAAFSAQSYSKVMFYLRFVFAARFLSWFGIGLGIYLFGPSNHEAALWCIGIGLFVFSFSAGFGAIYFNEILGKVFTNRYRGKVIAQRQIAAGLGALSSGIGAAFILENFQTPYSFAYLFFISALMMLAGVIPYALIKEPEKTNTRKKENSFLEFIQNSFSLLGSDPQLRRQIRTYLLAYGHLFSLPFIILQAESKLSLSGIEIGYLLTSQIVGGMLSNFLWGKISLTGKVRIIVITAFIGYIIANSIALIAADFWTYAVIFFLLGSSIDGMRLAFSNNILVIAPENLRPVYIALQSNLTSIGLFFAVPGSLILNFMGFDFLCIFTIGVMCAGLISAKNLH